MYSIGIDKDRILIRKASADKITGRWKEAMDEIVNTCRQHLGSHLISVYIGGSVAHGAAIEGKSDVDSYVIVDLTADEIEQAEKDWVNTELKRIDALFPFQRRVELHLISADRLGEGKKFQMKVFATCVHGKNFDDELPEYRLDRETLGRIRVDIAHDIHLARADFDEADTAQKIQRVSAWISRRLIRSAGMMCMWQGDMFTMDIPTLAEMVSSYYPEQKGYMAELLGYTENPPFENKRCLIYSIHSARG